MKIEDAEKAIDEVLLLKTKGNKGDLAKLKRGLSTAQSLPAYSVLGRIVFPYSQTMMDAVSVVCGAFAADDCRKGSVPLMTVLADLEKDASDTRRVKRLLSCTTTEEVSDVLRHTLRYVLNNEHKAVDWPRLLADAINFDVAGDAIRMRWASDAARAFWKKENEA